MIVASCVSCFVARASVFTSYVLVKLTNRIREREAVDFEY